MRIGRLALSFILSVAGAEVHAAGWYAATNGAGSPGTNWLTAFTNVQDAVNAGGSNDTIYLAAHTFNIGTNLAMTGQVVIAKSWLTLQGGYAGTGTPGPFTNRATVFNLQSGSNRLFYLSGVTNVTLDRLTLSNGIPPTGQSGGGMLVERSTNVSLSSCVFVTNHLKGTSGTVLTLWGGGLFATNSYLTVSNCQFIANYADYANGGDGAKAYGGGMAAMGGGATIRDTIARGNWTSESGWSGKAYGGGFYFDGGAHLLWNSLVYGNSLLAGRTTEELGHGLYVASGTTTVEQCDFISNRREGARRASGTLTVRDSIVRGHLANDLVSPTWVSNSIVGLSTSPVFERGIYLATNSPAVDAGSRSVAAAGLSGYTTRADGIADTDPVDIGYHFAAGIGSVSNLYVSPSSGNDDGSYSGTSSSQPFRTISNALTRVADGTHIYLDSGIYSTNSGERFPLVLNRMGLQLLGTNSATTTLNATGAAQRVITVINGIGDCKIQGISIVNGNPAADGAGVNAIDSDLQVLSCIFSNNIRKAGGSYGGGLYANYVVSLLVSNCLFFGNQVLGFGSSVWGGGMFVGNSVGQIVNSSFVTNTAAGANSNARGFGAGLESLQSTLLLRNVLFARNRGTRATSDAIDPYGNGAYIDGGAVTIESCTFATNCGWGGQSTNIYGEALRSTNSAVVTLTNTIFWGHLSDVMGSIGSIAFCDSQWGISNGVNNNISADPLFVDLAGGNYRLDLASPCINRGTNLSWMTNGIDLDGAARIQNVRADMGAYEKFIPLSISNLPAQVGGGVTNLNGTLLSTGYGNAQVSVYWGPVDGTNNKSAWLHTNDFGVCGVGPLSTNVTLDNGYSSFYYRYYATNSFGEEAWAPASEPLSVMSVWVEVPVANASEDGPVSGVFRLARPATATDTTVNLSYALSGTASNGVDYNLLTGAAVMSPGQSNVTVTLTPKIDHVIEGAETVILTLLSSGYAVGSPSSGTVTIADWTPPSSTYVSLSGSSGYATNWASALTNLQEALSATTGNGTNTIYLAAGTYPIAQSLNWTNSNVTLSGGWAGDGAPGTLSTQPTVIQPTGLVCRVFFVSGVANGILQNVVIQGGYQNPGNGGGLYLTNCQNVTIADSVIRSNSACGANSASVYGGGVCEINSTVLMTNILLQANTVVGGNDSSSLGGALAMVGGSVTARDCRVIGNTVTAASGNSSVYGAGLYAGGGLHLLRNCLVWGNAGTASGSGVIQGAGLHVAAGTGVVENCTVAGNRTEGLRQSGGSLLIRDSIVRSHPGGDVAGVAASAVTNSYIARGDRVFTNVNGNLTGDAGMERGLYLAPGSPCQDAGSRDVAAAGLQGYTTRADGVADSNTVDLGYHWTSGLSATVADLYVSPLTGSDSRSGTNWIDAFQTLSNAVRLAQDGTRIHLAAGAYSTGSGERFPIALNKLGMQLLGTNSATTILNAAGAGKSAVTARNVLGDGRIEGLKICNAAGDGYYGGGLLVSDSDLALVSCTFSNNSTRNAVAQGGGYGGGLYATWSSIQVSNNVFVGNTARGNGNGTGCGGGMALDNCRGSVENCLFLTNTAAGEGAGGIAYGGGLWLGNSPVWVVNTVLARGQVTRNDDSTPGRYGHGAYVSSGSASFDNCTFATNVGPATGATNWGDGLRVGAGTVGATNCIFWGHVTDVTGAVNLVYCDIGSGLSNGVNGNLSVDPQFVSVASNNFRLLPTSLCMNTGTNLTWMIGATDLDGSRRIIAGQVDRGAYEVRGNPGTSYIFR